MATVLPDYAIHAILYCTLAAFAGIVVFHSSHELKKILHPDETFVSARNTKHWTVIAMSVFASSMGNWILFSIPEVGATAGWWGIIGYMCAMVFPVVTVAIFGPYVRRAAGETAFGVTDYMKIRFGRTVHMWTALVSCFVMFTGLIAEYTTIGQTADVISPGFPAYAAIVPVGVVTFLYTLYSGLNASLVSDRYQASLISILLVMAVGAVVGRTDTTESDFNRVAAFTFEGFKGFIALALAVIPATFIDQSWWQRVFASATDRDARLGLSVGIVATTPFVLLLGIAGIVAIANDTAGDLVGLEYTSFFTILTRLDIVWVVFVFIVAVTLVASSVDTGQNALVSVFAGELFSRDINSNWFRVALAALNIPAMFLGTYGYSILTLFLIGDLLAATCLGPLVLGGIHYVSWIGAVGGFACGFLTIFIEGWIVKGDFEEGLRFITLPDGLTATSTVVAFIVVPAVSVLVTLLLSFFFPNKEPPLVLRPKDGDNTTHVVEPSSPGGIGKASPTSKAEKKTDTTPSAQPKERAFSDAVVSATQDQPKQGDLVKEDKARDIALDLPASTPSQISV